MVPKPTASGYWRWVVPALLLVTVSGAVVAYSLVVWHVFGNWTTSGTFGDSFGALNSLFSGLAFVAIALSHLLQRADLAVQRSELRKSAGRHGELMFAHQRQLRAMVLETKLASRRERYSWAASRGQNLEASQLEAEILEIERQLEWLVDRVGPEVQSEPPCEVDDEETPGPPG